MFNTFIFLAKYTNELHKCQYLFLQSINEVKILLFICHWDGLSEKT